MRANLGLCAGGEQGLGKFLALDKSFRELDVTAQWGH